MNKTITNIPSRGMNFKGFLKLAGIFAVGITLSACKGQISDKPPVHPNMNMDQQPRKEAQEINNFFADGRSMRAPVEGTVSRGNAKLDTEFYNGVDENGDFINTNPVDITKSFLYRGKERYDIFCAPCHGLTGAGDGIIMEGNYGYVPAPSYHEQRVRELSDGELYSAIANGVRTMPNYATQIKVEDRWAIVAYIRALQESQNVSEEELRQYEVDVDALKEQALAEKASADSAKAAQADNAPEPTVELGREVITANGCMACHNEDGSSGGIGPTWKGLYGSEGEVITEGGETITAIKDDEYLHESIVAPEATKPVDYAQGIMVSYSYLSDQEIESIILYIKNIDN